MVDTQPADESDKGASAAQFGWQREGDVLYIRMPTVTGPMIGFLLGAMLVAFLGAAVLPVALQTGASIFLLFRVGGSEHLAELATWIATVYGTMCSVVAIFLGIVFSGLGLVRRWQLRALAASAPPGIGRCFFDIMAANQRGGSVVKRFDVDRWMTALSESAPSVVAINQSAPLPTKDHGPDPVTEQIDLRQSNLTWRAGARVGFAAIWILFAAVQFADYYGFILPVRGVGLAALVVFAAAAIGVGFVLAAQSGVQSVLVEPGLIRVGSREYRRNDSVLVIEQMLTGWSVRVFARGDRAGRLLVSTGNPHCIGPLLARWLYAAPTAAANGEPISSVE